MWRKLELIINQLNIEKINSTKIILKKNIWGSTAAKQKPCGGNIIAIYNICF
jgi:hypothetical protein